MGKLRAILGGLFAATLLLASVVGAAKAAITSPVSVVLNTAGDFSTNASIQRTIDQSGLSQSFVSGVTNFDTYLAGNPTHTLLFDGYEWFAPEGAQASTIIYDFGQSYNILRMALWNEDSSGISSVLVDTSNDIGFGTFANVGSFSPSDNTYNQDYLAEVFDLNPDSIGRYVRLTAVAPGDGFSISMGEIAFDLETPDAGVPEPSSVIVWSLLGLTVAGGTWWRRRRAAA